MNKITFLTIVAEVMKGLVSYDKMMASLKRSCMRGEAQNLELMGIEEKGVDRLVEGIDGIRELDIPDETLDALVLRYLKNTQFLANIKEDEIDVSGLNDNLQCWKKTMRYKAL
ncbi:MAG: hypothetical protein OHK0032_02820 [Thermodesulfovibrionales bacterium]